MKLFDIETEDFSKSIKGLSLTQIRQLFDDLKNAGSLKGIYLFKMPGAVIQGALADYEWYHVDAIHMDRIPFKVVALADAIINVEACKYVKNRHGDGELSIIDEDLIISLLEYPKMSIQQFMNIFPDNFNK